MVGNFAEFSDILLNLKGISAPDMMAGRIPYALSAILLSSFLVVIFSFLGGLQVKNFTPLYWRVINPVVNILADKLNRPNRGRSALVFRGGVLTILFIILSCGFGAFLEEFIGYIGQIFVQISRENSDVPNGLFGYVYDVCLVMAIIPAIMAGGLWRAVHILAKGLLMKKGKGRDDFLKDSGIYYALSRSTRLNLTLADDYTIVRLCILFMIRAFDKMLVVPIFWYLIGGLPVLYAYAGLGYMKWRLGKDGTSNGFGFISERLERVFGAIPSIITSMILVMAAIFTPKASFLRAIRGSGANKDGRFSPHAQGGRPVTIAAWALDMSLGGAFIDYDGKNITYKWVGAHKSSARLDPVYLRRSLYLMAVSLLIFVLILVMMI